MRPGACRGQLCTSLTSKKFLVGKEQVAYTDDVEGVQKHMEVCERDGCWVLCVDTVPLLTVTLLPLALPPPEQAQTVKNTSTVAQLLRQFFTFYAGSFPFKSDVVSIRHGMLGVAKAEPSAPGRLCILDPLDATLDLGEAVLSWRQTAWQCRR